MRRKKSIIILALCLYMDGKYIRNIALSLFSRFAVMIKQILIKLTVKAKYFQHWTALPIQKPIGGLIQADHPW